MPTARLRALVLVLALVTLCACGGDNLSLCDGCAEPTATPTLTPTPTPTSPTPTVTPSVPTPTGT